jgi:cytochrome c oxidase subunit 3
MRQSPSPPGTYNKKYNSTQTLGIELGAMYWHFLDFLWVYLFLFLYFFK